MKKLIFVLMVCILIFGGNVLAENSTEYVIQNSSFPVYIDNKRVDFGNTPNLTVNGIQAVPVTFLCGYLGYNAESQNGLTYIREGNDCKNNHGTTEVVLFNRKMNKTVYYETKDGAKEVIQMPDDSEIFYIIGDEIYISPYHLCRVLDLKLNEGFTGGKIAIYTRDYLYAGAEENMRTIFVSDISGGLKIWYGDEICKFTSNAFIDEGGRTQIPIREFCEWLDKDIIWNQETKTVGISSVPASLKQAGISAGGDSCWFTADEKKYRVNGNYYEMDTEARIIDGKMYVPLRYLAEALCFRVEYNSAV